MEREGKGWERKESGQMGKGSDRLGKEGQMGGGVQGKDIEGGGDGEKSWGRVWEGQEKGLAWHGRVMNKRTPGAREQ